jgi:hypothetical protein
MLSMMSKAQDAKIAETMPHCGRKQSPAHLKTHGPKGPVRRCPYQIDLDEMCSLLEIARCNEYKSYDQAIQGKPDVRKQLYQKVRVKVFPRWLHPSI